jgi:hypothetical protein
MDDDDMRPLRDESDMVSHPTHYTRGPKIAITVGSKTIVRVIECIEVVRHIKDFRLATATKYIWRVGFGGKWDDVEDVRKAIFYLNDFIEHPPEKQ